MKNQGLYTKKQLTRRAFLARIPGVLSWGGLVPCLRGATTLLGLRAAAARAQASTPQRLLVIYLPGAWDSALGTDPVVGAKAAGGGYAPVYNSLQATTVPGKSSLVVGPGLAPAASAFAGVPTAFVNGVYVEVTGHDLAHNYILSGRLSLSLSREYPAVVAMIADASGSFPSHVVLGQAVPLGDTKLTSPPFQSSSVVGLTDMLTKPGAASGILASTLSAAYKLADDLEDAHGDDLSPNAAISLKPWRAAQQKLAGLYGAEYGPKLVLTDAIKARYGVTEDGSPQALMAGAFLVLKSGMTPFVSTMFTGEFDTHTNHMARHLPALRAFATALSVLVKDLMQTPDPAVPSVSLASTTTIMITSEFVRTPKLNLAGGTDHWQSASAIFMGNGVKDNSLVGATDVNGAATGWSSGIAVPFNDGTKILPDHIAATILRQFNLPDLANKISGVQINGIFA